MNKKANTEKFIFEVQKIKKLYEGATRSNDNKPEGSIDDNFYNVFYYDSIQHYDLTTLKNIVNDYYTVFPYSKKASIINEIYKEINTYISNLPYDVTEQKYNKKFVKEPNKEKLESLLSKLKK